MVTSKKLGNQFEKEFCNILYCYGFWCHNLAQNAAGQPADVIAVKNGHAHLIDCKVCSHDKFPLSRIEENQRFAMRMWRDRGRSLGWFALKTTYGIYMIDSDLLTTEFPETHTLNMDDIRQRGKSLARWLEEW
jgi:archaeal holliday junction resolvase (hjc)